MLIGRIVVPLRHLHSLRKHVLCVICLLVFHNSSPAVLGYSLTGFFRLHHLTDLNYDRRERDTANVNL